ncbi:nucleoside-diphosphate-sugar epimerase [Hoeflea sp. IMCC20628]|uniref:NAD-dependent epimerase/dehydratase family protein n=1 Tax=Hoeflea sp. IMCC20628 TaxID=1620421 RepID=UPI00063AFFE5|nr:NAD(P)-dependent oxidoreductase [Hoeflea sp. IMCC20628]AKH99164.1 nucleoside-diphosphate-sugar epimerase [Hoeflea sp. IMCC20628]
MKALVSGGTGLVGRFIVEELLDQGYEVTVGGRTQPAERLFSRPVGFVPLVLDPDRDQAVAFEGADHFVHAAFDHLPGKYRGGEGSDPDGFRARNLDGTMRLFQTARQAGVKRCVFLSSRAVYGPQRDGTLLNEATVPRPDTLYGAVKLAAEQALAAMAGPDFIATSLRVTGVYGTARPGQSHKWQALFADYLAGRPVEPRLATEVHGRDVAQAVQMMLELQADKINGLAFNVSDLLLDRHDLLRLLQAAAGSAHQLPAPVAGDAPWQMDTARLRKLGWTPGGKELLATTVRSLHASPVID